MHRVLTPHLFRFRAAISPVTVGLVTISLAMSACGGDDAAGTAATTTPTPATVESTAPPTVAPDTASTPTSPVTSVSPETTSPPATTAPETAPPATTVPAIDEAVATEVERLLAASLTDIAWDCCGAAGNPTGAAVAIRVPGAQDLLIGVGQDVSGGNFDPTAQFDAASIGFSLVQSIALLAVDEGLLDPSATVDQWAPAMPNASQVTIQMLIDGTTGWGKFNSAIESNVTADLNRRWSLAEVVDVAATIPPESAPGESTWVTDISSTVLAYVLEQTTGKDIATLVTEYLAEPLGLQHTSMIYDAPGQSEYQHGVFVLGGQLLDTAATPTDAYFSFLGGSSAASSSLPDLLELLTGWVDGTLLGDDRRPTPSKFQSANTDPFAANTIFGSGIPVNGYCDPRPAEVSAYPCTPAPDGTNVMAVGRTPNGVGTTTILLHFPATGVSIAMHHNSQEWVAREDLIAVAIDIHDLVSGDS